MQAFRYILTGLFLSALMVGCGTKDEAPAAKGPPAVVKTSTPADGKGRTATISTAPIPAEINNPDVKK